MQSKYYVGELSLEPNQIFIGSIPIQPGQVFEMVIYGEWKFVRLENKNRKLSITGLPFKVKHGRARLDIPIYNYPQTLHKPSQEYCNHVSTLLKENKINLSTHEFKALVIALFLYEKYSFPKAFVIRYTAFKYQLKQSF